MVDIKITECPFCHGTEFLEGKQNDSRAEMQSTQNMWYSGVVYHTVCRNCGSIVRSYVKNPENMLKKKDRKED